MSQPYDPTGGSGSADPRGDAPYTAGGYGSPGHGYGQPGYGPPTYGQQSYGYQQGFPGYQPYGYRPQDDPYAKSRLAAGLLGILLGGLGIHRFYLGYVGIGIAQIVVTFLTAGVGAIWGLIEGILYLTSRTGTYSVDATGRPLRA